MSTVVRLQHHFYLDPTLTALGRHLRFLGLDTIYGAEAGEQAEAQGRTVVTLDSTLPEKLAPQETVLLRPKETSQQLQQVLMELNLGDRVRSRKGVLSLCLDCNFPIVPVRADQIHEHLSQSLLLEQANFLFCTRCERVYWRNAYFTRLEQWIESLLGTPDKAS